MIVTLPLRRKTNLLQLDIIYFSIIKSPPAKPEKERERDCTHQLADHLTAQLATSRLERWTLHWGLSFLKCEPPTETEMQQQRIKPKTRLKNQRRISNTIYNGEVWSTILELTIKDALNGGK